jgi:hypothetical protein
LHHFAASRIFQISLTHDGAEHAEKTISGKHSADISLARIVSEAFMVPLAEMAVSINGIHRFI